MLVLLDTGILLRLLEPTDPHHGGVRAAVRALRARGDTLVIAAQNAYVRAIASGAKPDVAFDVARAAYRALYPGLSGAVLDSAVARALASGPSSADPSRPEPRGVPAATTGHEVAGEPQVPSARQP